MLVDKDHNYIALHLLRTSDRMDAALKVYPRIRGDLRLDMTIFRAMEIVRVAYDNATIKRNKKS